MPEVDRSALPVTYAMGPDDDPGWRIFRDLFHLVYEEGMADPSILTPSGPPGSGPPGTYPEGARLLDTLGLHGIYEQHVRSTGVVYQCPRWCVADHPRAGIHEDDHAPWHVPSGIGTLVDVSSYGDAGLAISVPDQDFEDLTPQRARLLAQALNEAAEVVEALQASGALGRPTPELVQRWLLARRTQGLAENTLKLQGKCLGALARDVDLLTVSEAELEAWLAGHPQWKPATRSVYRNALRAFFAWAHRSGLREDNPAGDIAAVRVPKRTGRPVSEAALRAALAVADPRARLMIRLAAHAGLRVSEISGLRREDLDEDLLTVRGKGGRTRIVPIGGELLAELQACPPGWIFPRYLREGEPLGEASVAQSIVRYLPPGYTSHRLRHRFASRIYAQTKDLMTLQQLLGHANVETTRIYIETSLEDLRRAAATALD